MARKNNRFDNHQSIGEWRVEAEHTHTPIPTRWGHMCLGCGRALDRAEVNR